MMYFSFILRFKNCPALFILLQAVVLCLVLSFPAVAQNSKAENKITSLILSNSASDHFLSPYLIQYQDKDNNLTPNDIISGLFATEIIAPNTGSIVTLDPKNSSVWMSFHVTNRSTTSKWKIDFGSGVMGRFGLFDSVDAYIYETNSAKTFKQEISVDGSIKLNLPLNSKSQILIKVSSKKGLPATIPLRIIDSEQKLAKDESPTITFFSVFIMGMIFFFAAVAYIKSQYQYLYFCFYYFLFGLLLLTQNIFVVSNTLFIGAAIIPLLFLMVTIASLMIANIFWNIDSKSKTLQIGFIGIIILSILCFLSALFLPIGNIILHTALYYGPSLAILAFIPLVSIVQTQRGQNESTAFMLGWFILLFGLCITGLALIGFMPTISTAINAFWFTLLPQAFFFVMAAKMALNRGVDNISLSRTLEIEETETVSRLRHSKETTEQDRLLKVIEQERKVLGELRKSEARRTEEMRQAKDIADQANKAKSAFLAVVSHEIRTPMTGIMGMVRLLINSHLTKEQKEYAQTIQDSSDAMLALLNDILDFEKIEQGKMAFEKISFDLHRLVNGVGSLMKGHAAQKNIELNIKIGKDVPKYVYGDPTRLRQVLLNLAGNAVKFTSVGHVTLKVEAIKEIMDGHSEIYFGISDSGVGISKEAQQNLFSPFAQADSSIARQFGGTGLGLAISKGLVGGMGSVINISSNEGEGSTFFFTLTMPVGSDDDAGRRLLETKKAQTIKPLKIMVVDDNNVNQKVIAGFLKQTPHIMTFIDDAQMAINRLEKESFDLILMDIEMPGLKGDEATKYIRQSAEGRIKNIPILALTGNVMPQDVEKYYEAGMNGIIEKPIDMDILKSTINKAGQNIFDNPQLNAQKSEPVKSIPTAVANKKITAEIVIEKKTDALPFDKSILNSDTLDTLKGHLKIEDIQSMLKDVIDKSAEIIAAMNDALDQNKMTDLSARGHELKGMAGNFGLVELSTQAGKIEAKAKTDAIIIMTSLLEPLPAMQKRAKEALDHWIDNNKG